MTAGLPVMNAGACVRGSRALLFVLTAGCAFVLSACGDGNSSGSSSATTSTSTTPYTPVTPSTPATVSTQNSAPTPGVNHAPTISGTPLPTVLAGTQYAFMPIARDADNDSLTFSISGCPPWATFSAGSGALIGTPGPADVGTYSNITIIVSDGRSAVALQSFSIQVVATATGSATLTWNPPTENTDGSALTDLAGYKIYWGTSPGNYTNSATLSNPGLSSYVVEQLTPATWYFVATAVNGQGVESAFSGVASKTIL